MRHSMRHIIISILSTSSMFLTYNLFFGCSNFILYTLILLGYSIIFSASLFLWDNIKNKANENKSQQKKFSHTFLMSLLSISLTLTVLPIDSFYVESLIFLCLIFFLMPVIIIAIISSTIFDYISIFYDNMVLKYGNYINNTTIIFCILAINILNMIKTLIINI